MVAITNLTHLTLRDPPGLLRGRGHGTHVGSVGACAQQKPKRCGRKTSFYCPHSLFKCYLPVTWARQGREGGGGWGGCRRDPIPRRQRLASEAKSGEAGRGSGKWTPKAAASKQGEDWVEGTHELTPKTPGPVASADCPPLTYV